MSATVNCPQCDAPLELPDDVPVGKRLQCPDCGTSFSPPSRAERSSHRPRRRDDDDLPPRRKKENSVAIVAAIVLIVLIGLGIAGAVVWVYLEDSRTREQAANSAPPSKSPVEKTRPVGGAPGAGGQGDMMPPGGMPPGGMPGGVPMPGGMPDGGNFGPVVQLKIGDAAPEIEGQDL